MELGTARTSRGGVLVAAAAVAVLVAMTIGAPAPAGAAAGHPRGPDPTTETIAAPTGPFAVATVTVPSSVAGFGGGQIYYPTDRTEGTFGAYAFAPGTYVTHSLYTWIGTRVASQGFVVFLIDTNTRVDLPPSRGDQLRAALDYLVDDSAVRDRVDPARLAVGGHSNGGGGALEAAVDDPTLQAVVALQPWNPTKSFPGIRTPTMLIGAEDDAVAKPEDHAELFYESIPASTPKAYAELAGERHGVGTASHTTQAVSMIAWLKRYVDDDPRYEQFLCPPPQAPSATLSEYRHTCPK